MFRYSCMALAAAFVFGAMPSAEAQRNNAEIVQGLSSSQLTSTVEELRVSNAELRARMTGLESDRAQLTGKVETLEFLLGQSRDEINRMQTDDAELERLITRLEDNLFPADLSFLTTFTSNLGPELPFFQRLILANSWLTKGLVVSSAEASNTTNAMIRTTTAATMMSRLRLAAAAARAPKVTCPGQGSVDMLPSIGSVLSKMFTIYLIG